MRSIFDKRGSKKAAFEMSMSTVVIIVLAVVFLILGLVLLRNIYGFADKSMGEIDDNLMSEMKKLFPDTDTKITLRLTDKTAKIRSGTTNFGIGVAARTLYGNAIPKREESLQYKLELDTESTNNCVKKIGATSVEKWFNQRVSSTTDVYNNIDDYNADAAFARIQISIPESTPVCTQKVYIEFIDKTNTAEGTLPLGGSSFTIEVLRKALI